MDGDAYAKVVDAGDNTATKKRVNSEDATNYP